MSEKGGYNYLSRWPVLRLLLPMMLGILLYRVCISAVLPVALVAVSIILIVGMRLSKSTPVTAMRKKRIGLLPLALAMMAVGWFAAYIASPATLKLDKVNGKVACGRIEKIEYNEKSMLMQVNLLYAVDKKTKVKKKFQESHIHLSTRGCDYSYVAGDLVAFKLDLEKITNLGNPDEMDYARFLFNKGIQYREHVDINEVEKLGSSPTIMTWSFNLRQRLQHLVLNSQLEPSTQALLIAMLLGNDDFIDRETRDEFSLSGVAHVLALSGLHVAIITALIWFLLFPLDYLRGKRLRLLLTLVLLVVYAFMTGLSPSVIRSTVMIGFVFMSMIFYRKSSPLNSLAAAALVILVFSPNSLYGVGFQLSFITVAAIIIFYKMFDVKVPHNKVLNYVYTSLLTSIVAMVSTIMLTAYYFNTISMLSIVSNVVIMPIVPLFMGGGAVALLLLMMGGEITILDKALDWMASVMNSAIGWFSSLPLSSSNVYVTWVAVVIYYAVLVLIVLWLSKGKPRLLLTACVLVALGLVHGLIVDARSERSGLVVFNSYNSTPVLYFSNNNALLWVPDAYEDYDKKVFMRQHRAFLAHHRIDSVTLVDSMEQRLGGAVIKPPYAQFDGTSMMAVGKGRWKHYEREDSSDVRFDMLLVTKRYHSEVGVVTDLVPCDTILLSGAIYSDDLPALVDECKALRLPYQSIKSEGAFVRMR